MKKKSKRFYGMTTTQVAILGGLALMALCSMSVIGFAVLSTLGEERAAQNIPPTAAIAATLPPEPSATPEATSSPTPQPTPLTLPEGWVKFESQGASIWLPPSYIGGDMVDNRKSTIEFITSQVKFSEFSLQKIKTSPPEVILFMVENREDVKDTFPTVAFYRFQDENKTDLTDAVNQVERTPNATVLRRKRLTVSGYEAMGIEYEHRDREAASENAYINNTTAIIIRGNNILWIVMFTSPPEALVEISQVIEASLGTIILP